MGGGHFAVSSHHLPLTHQFLDRILSRQGAKKSLSPDMFVWWCTALPSRQKQGNQHISEWTE